MTDLWYGTSGPHDAEIVLVGEAWGFEEAAEKKPFVGQSGKLLTGMLAEAGIDRDKILLLNVVAARPPQNNLWNFFHTVDAAPPGSEYRRLHPMDNVKESLYTLHAQIIAYPRKLIIAAGNYALWALTPHAGAETKQETYGRRAPNGIMNWRGSMTYYHTIEGQRVGIPLLPIIHPAAIMRQWSLRAPTVHDLRARVPKALKEDWRPNPTPTVWAPPTFEQAKGRLEHWLRRMDSGETLPLACDIETIKKHNLMTVIGFADSTQFAMAIPLLDKTDVKGVHQSFWEPEQEATLTRLILRVVSHPNVFLIGQNFIYDMQYFTHWYGVRPNLKFDTMLAWHLLFPGLPKALFYLASMMCDYYWFWKDDAKEWDEHGTLSQLLEYNGLDLLRTFECYLSLKELIPRMGMERQWGERMENNDLAFRLMQRGIRVDTERRSRISMELLATLNEIYARLERIIPTALADQFVLRAKTEKAVSRGKKPPKAATKTPWYTSADKQKIVFQDILGIKLPKSRKTGTITLGHEALSDLKLKHPEWTNLLYLIEDARSVGVFRSTFVEAALDEMPHRGKLTKRMLSSFNPGGTETFRWSSSTNAFGRGANMQNIPVGEEE